MGAKNLLEKLHKYLDKGESKKDAVRCEQIDIILDKLEKKEQKLRKKLDAEKDKNKQRELSMEVRIISLQRKKGSKRRKELKAKCK